MVKPKEFDKLICGKSICAKKQESIEINDKKIETIFQAKVSKFSSGGYISVPQKYHRHKAYVIVMEDLAR